MSAIDTGAVYAAAQRRWPEVNIERTWLDVRDENRWESPADREDRHHFEEMVRRGEIVAFNINFSMEEVEGYMLGYNREHDRLMLVIPKEQNQ